MNLHVTPVAQAHLRRCCCPNAALSTNFLTRALTQTSQAGSVISLEFSLKSGDTIYICSYRHKDAFKHADFYLDLHVPRFADEKARRGYQRDVVSTHPPAKLWEQRTHIGGDSGCDRLYELPTGHHVLTVKPKPPAVATPAAGSSHTIAITHLITF